MLSDVQGFGGTPSRPMLQALIGTVCFDDQGI
jgi:hypothetical protein